MIQIDPAKLDLITLDKGAHDTPGDGLCLMEAVAYLAGEPHTDRPKCVSPVLGAYGRALNDILPQDRRQQLIPLIPRIVGTAGDGRDESRSYMALDWLIRTYLPAWLDLAGITEEARVLRELGRIVDLVSAQRVRPAVLAGQDKAAAAGAAAGAAAWAAARAAAGAAAWAAAGAAAGVAAGDAARVAARVAAGAAARVAARAALTPTVDALQHSAIDLFAAMVDPQASE
jgi:hypothetical protein